MPFKISCSDPHHSSGATVRTKVATCGSSSTLTLIEHGQREIPRFAGLVAADGAHGLRGWRESPWFPAMPPSGRAAPERLLSHPPVGGTKSVWRAPAWATVPALPPRRISSSRNLVTTQRRRAQRWIVCVVCTCLHVCKWTFALFEVPRWIRDGFSGRCHLPGGRARKPTAARAPEVRMTRPTL